MIKNPICFVHGYYNQCHMPCVFSDKPYELLDGIVNVEISNGAISQ